MTIPIKNLYYMLIYAWDVLEIQDDVSLEMESLGGPQDLLARLFCVGLQRISFRGLERKYQEFIDETYQPSGKFEVHATVTNSPRLAGRVVVSQDGYSSDCVSNRALLATGMFLLSSCGLDKGLGQEIRRLLTMFGDVKLYHLNQLNFDHILLHRNNLHYKLALRVADLVRDRNIYQSVSGVLKGVQFNTEKLMWKVFEKFVRNFLKSELTECEVKSERIPWQNLNGLNRSLNFVPFLHPDIVLKSDSISLIIDTKYYKSALEKNRRETIKSSHLYQLYSYLENFSRFYSRNFHGLMLYPKVDRELDIEFETNARRMHFKTIDLGQDWTEVRSNLLLLVSRFQFC